MSSIQIKIFIALIFCCGLLLPGCTTSVFKGPGLLESVANNDEALEMLYGIGRIAERNDKTQKAIEAYQTILESRPEHAQTLHRMGVIDARRGLINDAIAWFNRAAQSAEPSAELLGDLGYVHYLAGDLESATTYLEQGLQLQPDNKRMLNNLALVSGSMKQFDRSMQLFLQTGTEAEALASMAFIQSRSGNIEQARETYLKSLELDQSLEVAANGLIELHRARPDVAANADKEKVLFPDSDRGQEQLAGYFAQPESSDHKFPKKAKAVLTPKEAIEPSVEARLRGPATCYQNEEADFSIVVQNESSSDVFNVEVQLELDASTKIVSVSREAWLQEESNTITWKFSNLSANSRSEIQFQAMAKRPGSVKQRLTVLVDGQPQGKLKFSSNVVQRN